jgi:hypothetical protein
MDTASIVAEFKGDLDGEDRLLIDADSPRGALLASRRSFNELVPAE